MQIKIPLGLTAAASAADERFKRSVYWNEYKLKIGTKDADKRYVTRFPLDASFQGVNRLFVLAFNDTIFNDVEIRASNIANRVQRSDHRKYFLPRVDIPISDQIKRYDEIRKITTGKGDDYTTGC